MRKFIPSLLLTGLLLGGRVPAQTEEGCRMTADQILPIIDRYNPFFTDHTWDNDEKTETARMDPARTIVIRQKACLRHHILFSMHIDSSEIAYSDRFWISEVLVMLKRVYFNDLSYLEYKKNFEKEYIRQFLAAGLNSSFNFIVNDRTFICEIETGEGGANVKLESVKFLLKEKIHRPGIAREMDDGWYITKKSQ
jgi:hypothetical protein